MKTFFADPYASWQRGTNENHNGLIRRYLPKGTSFNDLTQEELDDIVWEINNRSRKILNFSTLQEVFNLWGVFGFKVECGRVNLPTTFQKSIQDQ